MGKKKIYIAHSVKVDEERNINIPVQPYEKHIEGVYSHCLKSLNRIELFVPPLLFPVLKKAVLLASIYHDVGKLDDQAQSCLYGEIDGKMINHVDAGVAILLYQYKKTKDAIYLISAYIILAHHIGLPNFNKIFKTERQILDIIVSPTKYFRDRKSLKKYKMGRAFVKTHVDKNLKKYISIHNRLCSLNVSECVETTHRQNMFFMNKPSALKAAISILVDADHGDTSINYGDVYPVRMKHITPDYYLNNLNNYLKDKNEQYEKGLIKCSEERFRMRQEFFQMCVDIDYKDNFYLVDGTVGIGKTFAIMGMALELAKNYNLDTLIFVLPYIALIDQSADEYIKSVFDKPSDATYHFNIIHSVFKSKNIFHRKYAKGFNAPLNITTSVNFFDIIASNDSSIFKYFHKFIGSVIIIDEYHAVASYEFWPAMLKIMKELSELFSCKFIFSSGTPVEFWDIDKISTDYNVNLKVRKVISDDLYGRMITMEEKRVQIINSFNEEWSFEDLVNNVIKQDYSTFVILNTRRKSVVFAQLLAQKTNKKVFLRFSGLAPKDRKKQLDEIKSCLELSESVIVIATQGSDIGLDLSFHCGYKECSNYDSAGQMNGRINRGCEFNNSFLHVFKLSETPLNDGVKYYDNPSFKYRREIFESDKQLHNSLSPEYSTYVARREIDALPDPLKHKMDRLFKLWNNKAFEDFGEEFSLINMPMIHVLVDVNIFQKMKKNEYIPYADLQNSIVNVIWSEKNMDLLKDHLVLIDDEIEEDEEEDNKRKSISKGLFFWNGVYDDVNFGIFADPVFGLISPKTLII